MEKFLEEEERRRRGVQAALEVLGSLEADEAEALRDSVKAVRATWRSS